MEIDIKVIATALEKIAESLDNSDIASMLSRIEDRLSDIDKSIAYLTDKVAETGGSHDR